METRAAMNAATAKKHITLFYFRSLSSGGEINGAKMTRSSRFRPSHFPKLDILELYSLTHSPSPHPFLSKMYMESSLMMVA